MANFIKTGGGFLTVFLFLRSVAQQVVHSLWERKVVCSNHTIPIVFVVIQRGWGYSLIGKIHALQACCYGFESH